MEGTMIEIIGGIIGFEEHRFFNLVHLGEDIYKLINLETNLYFILLDYKKINGYSPKISNNQLKLLQIEKSTNTLLINIANFNDTNKPTINLKSPVLINKDLKLGIQIVLEEEWPLKYPSKLTVHAENNV
jgi:flagellar assembly factor FliW